MASSKSAQSTAWLFSLKNLLLLPTAGILLGFLIVLGGVWRTGNRLMTGIESFFNAPSPTPQADVSSLIVDRIQGVKELTTAVFVMEAVVPTVQERKLGNFAIATTKLLYIARGEVRAGVDLSELTVDNIKVDDRAVRVQLPAPQILDRKIDVDRSQVYDYDRGFLNLGPDVAPQLQTLAQRKTLDKIVAAACDRGVLEEANERAKLAITQLLSTAGYTKVEVRTTSPSQTCQSSIL